MTETTCQEVVTRRVNRGVMAKGTDSRTSQVNLCGKAATEGSSWCARHAAVHAREAEQAAALRGTR